MSQFGVFCDGSGTVVITYDIAISQYCASFVFSTLGYQTPMFLYGIDYLPLMIFLDGCLTSGGVWLIHTLQEFFERAFYPDSE